MIVTKVTYYLTPKGDNPFAKFLDLLEHKQQTKVLRLIMQIEEYGLISVLPHTKRLLGTPFWELRILGKDNLRVIYVIPHKDSVLVIHGFNKKTQKTPLREIQTALKRFREWQLNH